jgi:hypothetical protein
MSYQPTAQIDEALRLRAGPAVSWGAVLAGAVAAISLSILLLTLGTGLGFAAISPWAGRGASASAFAMSGAIWLIVTQWISAAVGGYLAGRLRHRWLATHQHEVFFRDTAHGLVTWSLATLVVVVSVSSALNSVGAGAARIGSAAAGVGARAGLEVGGEMGPRMMHPGGGPFAGEEPLGAPGGEQAYSADKLFRAAPGGASSGAGGSGAGGSGAGGPGGGADIGRFRMEAEHIAARAAVTGEISPDDRNYLVALAAAKAGVSTDEAQKRVDAFVADVKEATDRAKAAADQARKTAAQAAIFTALAMMIGAFIASVSAALGGRLRDEHS